MLKEYSEARWSYPRAFSPSTSAPTTSSACKNGGATVSTFESAVPLTETVLLGNVAYRAGHPIEWNSENLTVENDPDAAALIRRPYRRGWEVDWAD